MFELLLLPISFFCGLATYKGWEGRHPKTENFVSEIPRRNPNVSSIACTRIVGITSTNNSYDPMGDVLSDLDVDEVRILLGKALRTDMEGYVQ